MAQGVKIQGFANARFSSSNPDSLCNGRIAVAYNTKPAVSRAVQSKAVEQSETATGLTRVTKAMLERADSPRRGETNPACPAEAAQRRRTIEMLRKFWVFKGA